MADLAYPPCERPGCKSPGGHPNCRCYSNISTDNLAKAGYQRPGSTLGLKKRTNPDTGQSWYSGPGNGVEWSGSTTPTNAEGVGRSLASKVVKYAKWGAATLSKIGSTYFAEGGAVGDHNLIGDHHEKDCPHYRDGGEVDEINEFHDDPSLAVDQATAHHGLLHSLKKTGHHRSGNTEHFIDSVKRGRKLVDHHTSTHFDKSHEPIEADKNDVKALREHLDELRKNPGSMLDVGGDMGLPNHQGALASTAATAHSYLDSLRPQQPQAGPLDEPAPIDKMADQHYMRQLSVAQSPLSVLHQIRDGTIQPNDMQTLQTIYPHLTKSLQNKVGEALIEAKTNEVPITGKHKMGLSHLFGSPVDYASSPAAAQAIIASAGMQQSNQPGKKSGATAATLKQINKTDDMALTDLQAASTREKKTD